MIQRVSLAFLGGCAGGALRLGIQELWPTGDGIPWSLVVINLVGSFAIGIVGVLWGGRSRLWALLGPGVLGGFTTLSGISTLAWTTEAGTVASLAVLGASLIVCTIAARLGITLGERMRQGAS